MCRTSCFPLIRKDGHIVFKQTFFNYKKNEIFWKYINSLSKTVTVLGFSLQFGRANQQWIASPPMTRSINSRVLRVGVSMPPWQTRMFLDIHLDPAMSLTVARDFISQLHAYAPHMHWGREQTRLAMQPTLRLP